MTTGTMATLGMVFAEHKQGPINGHMEHLLTEYHKK